MKLSAARECYYSHSGNASAAARQVAFAGIAVVWVFNKSQSDRVLNLPGELLVVLLWLCAALALDLLQYTLSTAIWGFWSRRQEARLSDKFHEDPDVEPPSSLNWPGIGAFWGKLGALFVAYVHLGCYLFSALPEGAL